MMRSSSIGALALLVLSAMAPASLSSLSAFGPGASAADWATYNSDDQATNFSPLNSIDKTNVKRLGLVWAADLDENGVIEGTPLAVNGVIYCTANGSVVYAFDARSGKRLWKYDPEIWKRSPSNLRTGYGISRGVAYADGRIFLGAHDGRLIALDAASGTVIWSVETFPLNERRNITGAPRVFKGKVIIGNGVSEFRTRGYVSAYDAATGRQLWRFYTVPGRPEENKGDPVMERAAKTWEGEYWKGGGGGNVWDGIAVDDELNRIYVGTANANPWNPHERNPHGADNLFTAAIVALDADTGKYIWHYQVNPNDSWDYDAANQITLADLTIDGKPRKVLMQAPKNGFFYVIDRVSGKIISAGKIGKVTWADKIDLKTGRPVENKGIRYENGESLIWPSIAGIHNWMSMSFNPQTKTAFIPTMQMASRFSLKPDEDEDGPQRLTVAFDDTGADDGKGALVAWDPISQKLRWKVSQDRVWNGGVMSTAGDLVFQGGPTGYLNAYDGSTGALLWRFFAGSGILGAPISYSIGDKQYVAVQTGDRASSGFSPKSGTIGWKYGAQPHRLLAFSLDGTAVLPPTPPPDPTIHAVDDASIKIDEKDAAAGGQLYARFCRNCHGSELEADGPPAPDLRESKIALQRENVWNILHDGALIQQGMPRFPELTEEQAGQLYAYIRAGARKVLAGARPPQAEMSGFGRGALENPNVQH